MSKATEQPYMTGEEYRGILTKLGLSIHKSATFLQVDVTTSRRRANDRIAISFETAALLRLMIKLHITPAQVSRIVDKP